jgi:hypothetical protein
VAASAKKGVEPRFVRWTSWVVFVTVAVFVTLATLAAVTYPGGTWFDPARSGYDVVDNFLCDTLHASGLNGQPNPVGSMAMTVAMMALVPGLGGMWLLMPHLTRRSPRLGKGARATGLVSLPLVAAVPLVPTDQFPSLHPMVVVSASTTALLAAALAVYALVAEGRAMRLAAWVGAGVVTTVMIDAGLYVENQFFGAPLTTTVPALQKVAVSLLLSWMVMIALSSSRLRAATA